MYGGIPDWFQVDPLSDRTPLEQYFDLGAQQQRQFDETAAQQREQGVARVDTLREEINVLARSVGIEKPEGSLWAIVSDIRQRVETRLHPELPVPGKSDLVTDLATKALVARLRADAAQFSPEFEEIDADAFVRRVLDELGIVPPSGPPVVTFVIDTVNDGVAIEVGGKQVWWESSFDRLGQWLQGNELLDRVVILKFRVAEGADGG